MITISKPIVNANVIVIISILLWQFGVYFFEIPEYILPSPAAVGAEIVRDPRGLLLHTGLTLAESVSGIMLAIALAAVTSVLMFVFPFTERILFPALVGLKAVPIIAIAPLLIIWFGSGFFATTIMASLICYFPLVVGFARGLRSLSDDEILFLKNLSLTKFEEFMRFRLMKALPFILAGFRVSSVLGVIGAIVAEFSGATAGIGYLIIISSVRIDTPLLFVGIIAAAGCGVFLHWLASRIEKLILDYLHMEPRPD